MNIVSKHEQDMKKARRSERSGREVQISSAPFTFRLKGVTHPLPWSMLPLTNRDGKKNYTNANECLCRTVQK